DSPRDAHVRDLPELLRPGDLLVANRSRVLPARVFGRLRGGGRAELVLLRRLAAGRWQAPVRPARRLRPGGTGEIGDAVRVRIDAALDAGLREIVVEAQTQAGDADAALLAHGTAPLPPYIRAWVGDPERYQTMFADPADEGSAAAPTAGLHFTPALIEALR